MLGSFLKIDHTVVCFLKPLNSACFFVGNDRLIGKQVGSQASRISINAVPALKGLRQRRSSGKLLEWSVKSGKIGNDIKSFECFLENGECISFLVVIMTIANGMHPAHSGRHAVVCISIFTEQ